MCMHQVRRKVTIKRQFYEDLDQVLNHFSKYHLKITLDFNAKVGRENFFEPAIGNEGLLHDSNDNDVRIVNFAKAKILVVNSRMFPHQNIHKYT